jgi:hypothetical protein
VGVNLAQTIGHCQQRGGLIWFIWFVLFIWLVSFNETNQTNQINKRNQPSLARLAFPACLAQLSYYPEIGMRSKGLE